MWLGLHAEMDLRAILARIEQSADKKGMSLSAVAKAAGKPDSIQNIRRSIRDGRSGVNVTTLVALAEVLGVTTAWLMDGDAEASKPEPKQYFSSEPNMPVFAAAEGGDGNLILSTDPLEYVKRPYTLENIDDAYGIHIVGESMFPAFEPGDVAWINPRLPPIRGTDVVLYSVNGHGDAHASIKRLVGWTEAEWTVQQWNPPKTFPLARKDWPKVHRVVGKFLRR